MAPRPRPILWCFAALGAVLVVAVQREPFLRRLLLPTPPPSLLDRNVPAIDCNGVFFQDVIEEISKASGVRINADNAESVLLQYNLHLRNVTVSRALADLMVQDRHGILGNVIEERDGVIIIRRATQAEPQVVREYDIADLLPPPGIPSTVAGPWRALQPAGPVPDTRSLAHDELIEQVQRLLPFPAWLSTSVLNTPPAPRPTVRFGDRLIVRTDPSNQRIVRETLDMLRKNGFAQWKR